MLDLTTGVLTDSLESFAVTLQGRPYSNTDENLWGVTFASDDNTFYATLGTGGKTWLLRGNAAAHTLTTVIDNVSVRRCLRTGRGSCSRSGFRATRGRCGIWRCWIWPR